MATALQLTGKYLGTMSIQTVGQNAMQIRKFYIDITDNPAFPNTPEFQLKGDKVYLIDNVRVGQTITVHFNIDGRKYTNQQTGKSGVITNLSAWRIEIVQTQSAAAPQQQQRPPVTPANQQANEFPFAADDTSDLPF